MRIIKGYDYYDSAAMYGIDKSIVFVRDDKIVEDITLNCLQHSTKYHDLYGYSEIRLTKHHKRYPYEYKVLKVVVAGKLYVGVVFREREAYHKENFFFWDNESLNEFFLEHLGDDKVINYYSVFANKPSLFKEKSSKLIDLGEQEISPDDISVLIENKITIASSEKQKLWEDDMGYRVDHTGLDEIQLYKILPAPNIRQQIEQWVSGTLTGYDRPMIEVSDDVKKHKAGFDKWSFKKVGKNGK